MKGLLRPVVPRYLVRALLLVVSVTLVVVLCAVSAMAGTRWAQNGVQVCTNAGNQINVKVASDGTGGAVIVWQDSRTPANGWDIYAQRVDSSGTPLWAAAGVAIVATTGDQINPQIIPDGTGGAIVTWQDFRTPANGWDIYAQRINSSGTVSWAANGVAICIIANLQVNPQLITDTASGAIITWQDYRSGTNWDVYNQRIYGTGVVVYAANGVAMCVSAGDQVNPRNSVDAGGGSIIVWQDYRSGTNWDIYSQRAMGATPGTVQWTVGGVPICTAVYDQTLPQADLDGSGGAIFTWQDYRSGTNWDVYEQRVNTAGLPQYAANGVGVCMETGDQYGPQLTADGFGGAVIAWYDYRSATSYDVYAQRMNGSGSALWTASGVAVSTASGDQIYPQLMSDGSGGAVITWQDSVGGANYDVYTQRVTSGGTVAWTTNGVAVAATAGDQQGPTLTTDGSGGAIIAWQDGRGAEWNAYAQRVDKSKIVSCSPNVIARGQTLDVIVTGSDTHFANAPVPSQATISGANVTVNSTTYNSPTQVTVNVTVDASAALGPRDVNVITGTEVPVILTGGLSVGYPAPTVTGITPGTCLNNTTVHITNLAGTNFRTGATVKLKKALQPDITANLPVTVVSPTQIDCYINVNGADTGAWGVYVENDDTQSATLPGAFTIGFPAPTVTGITPGNGVNDATVHITNLVGAEFRTGAIVRLKKAGQGDIPGTAVTVVSGTQIDCYFDINGAATGAWDVYVENDDAQNFTLPGAFTVEYPAPLLSSVNPSSGVNDGLLGNLYLTGANFRAGAIVKLKMAGQPDVTATDVKVISGAKMICDVDLTGAATGIWDVYVENTDGKSDILPAAFTIANPAPTITETCPDCATCDCVVDVTLLSGTGFLEGAQVKLTKEGQSDITGTNVNVAASTKITCSFDLNDAQLGLYALTVTNTDGQSATKADAFTVKESEIHGGSKTNWYLAEGSTAWGFETYISIMNPNDEETEVKVTYMTEAGPIDGPEITLPPQSQTTVNPRVDLVWDTDFSTKVQSLDYNPIAVNRTMSWKAHGAPSAEGHASIGVIAPELTWYFAEGSSAWGFECWLLIQNPNDREAACDITYMRENGDPVTVRKKVPAMSRRSFSMSSDIGAQDAGIMVSGDIPVIAERAMYKNGRREGHESIGAYTPAFNYYLSEGTTACGFTTYVLVQNPNPSDANVIITYMTDVGPVTKPAFLLRANSRRTIRVNDEIHNQNVATRVNANVPIVAERSMYWGGETALGEACHNSVGMDSPHTTIYLPDARAGDGYETWTLVQNPNDVGVDVEVTYLTPTGRGDVSFTDMIPPGARRSYSMADRLNNTRASVAVNCLTPGKKVMAESSMYWNGRGAGTNAIGGYSD